jgi:hypothetical protein
VTGNAIKHTTSGGTAARIGSGPRDRGRHRVGRAGQRRIVPNRTGPTRGGIHRPPATRRSRLRRRGPRPLAVRAATTLVSFTATAVLGVSGWYAAAGATAVALMMIR